MMKLVTDVKKDVVAIKAGTDADGDVAVTANGVNILWIFANGLIKINNIPEDCRKLKEMGLKTDECTGRLMVNL